MKQFEVEVIIDATLLITVDADSSEQAMQKVEAELRTGMRYPDLGYVQVLDVEEVL